MGKNTSVISSLDALLFCFCVVVVFLIQQWNSNKSPICCFFFFLSGWYSISLIYDSVSKYASIKCLCDNSRHAVILLTFSAWMARIYECGLFFFFLKIHSELGEKKKWINKITRLKHLFHRLERRSGQKFLFSVSFFFLIELLPIEIKWKHPLSSLQQLPSDEIYAAQQKRLKRALILST